MELKERYEQLAAEKRNAMLVRDGQIAEAKEHLSGLTAEQKADEQMALDFDKMAGQYAPKK